MEYSVSPETCVLCEAGTAHPTHDPIELSDGVVSVMEFSVCDNCGAETARGPQININAKRAREARQCAQS